MINKSVLPSEEDIQFFRKNGYWLSKKVLDDDRIKRLRAAMDRVHAGDYETGRKPWSEDWRKSDDPQAIRKTDNSNWADLTLRELATDETIGAMAAMLTGAPEIRLWHDQLLFKPGQGKNGQKNSGNVGWHQDSVYWQCTTTDLLTAWVAFDDVHLDNGCMQFVPGSHEWDLLSEGNFFDTDLENLKRTIQETTGKAFETAPCILKAGEVSFHHCMTLHGSGPNITEQPRRSLVLHLQPEGAYYIPDTPSEGHMNVILLKQEGGKAGDKFKGKYWPVLYSAE